MKKKTMIISAVAVTSLALASSGFAQQDMEAKMGKAAPPSRQEEPQSSMPNASAKVTQQPQIIKASELIGYPVVNGAGEELGTIKEVVIDPQEGRVAYAVLSFGGFLGMGDKLFALPWESLALKPDEETFLLSVNKEKLKNAPGFDEENWPNMASREWGIEVHDYYDQKPYWNQGTQTPATPKATPGITTPSSPSPSESLSEGGMNQKPGGMADNPAP